MRIEVALWMLNKEKDDEQHIVLQEVWETTKYGLMEKMHVEMIDDANQEDVDEDDESKSLSTFDEDEKVSN